MREPLVQAIQISRDLAALAEQGNDKLWDKFVGKNAVVWTPSDKNALTRLLSTFLRRTSSAQCPDSLIMVSTIPMTMASPLSLASWMFVPSHF